MKTSFHNNRMTFKVLVQLFLLAFLAAACHRIDNIKKPDKLIPEKKLVGILTETSLADGLLSLPQVKDQFTNKDSLNVYKEIIGKYGYSKEEMDNTMNFYFLKRQKSLLKIYEQVYAKLQEMQVRINNEPIPDVLPESDVWAGPRIYCFPNLEAPGDGDFSIRVNPPGYYTISYTMTLYPGDQSKNACFTAWYVNADSAATAKKVFIPGTEYFRDGATRSYSISGKIDTSFPVLIEGKLFDHENLMDESEKYARIDKIIFTFTRQAL